MIAAMFPGQGSQSIGMMADFYNTFAEVKNLFNEASSVLGYDLWKLIQFGSEEELNKTIYTQPAMLVSGVAAWSHFKLHFDTNINLMAGHSLGEYTALVCSGALKFSDAVYIVKSRAEYMQNAVSENMGAMAAIIGLDDDAVVKLCAEAEENDVVSAANYNAPNQVVIAGHKLAVERAIKLSKKFGAKRAILLKVSVPSHCVLMSSASKKLRNLLKTTNFDSFSVPVLSNVNVEEYQDQSDLLEGLSNQVCMPVRWGETIQYFKNQGVRICIEFGPGGVLSGLCRRIDSSIKVIRYDSIDACKEINEENLK